MLLFVVWGGGERCWDHSDSVITCVLLLCDLFGCRKHYCGCWFLCLSLLCWGFVGCMASRIFLDCCNVFLYLRLSYNYS